MRTKKNEKTRAVSNAMVVTKQPASTLITKINPSMIPYSKGENIFKSPPWMKILVRDVNDPLSIMGDNKKGGINVIDLANIYSCPFVATQDLGCNFEDGTFSVLGRFSNADVRGCNLLIQ